MARWNTCAAGTNGLIRCVQSRTGARLAHRKVGVHIHHQRTQQLKRGLRQRGQSVTLRRSPRLCNESAQECIGEGETCHRATLHNDVADEEDEVAHEQQQQQHLVGYILLRLGTGKGSERRLRHDCSGDEEDKVVASHVHVTEQQHLPMSEAGKLRCRQAKALWQGVCEVTLASERREKLPVVSLRSSANPPVRRATGNTCRPLG